MEDLLAQRLVRGLIGGELLVEDLWLSQGRELVNQVSERVARV
jgi:hypothetical protein